MAEAIQKHMGEGISKAKARLVLQAAKEGTARAMKKCFGIEIIDAKATLDNMKTLIEKAEGFLPQAQENPEIPGLETLETTLKDVSERIRNEMRNRVKE